MRKEKETEWHRQGGRDRKCEPRQRRADMNRDASCKVPQKNGPHVHVRVHGDAGDTGGGTEDPPPPPPPNTCRYPGGGAAGPVSGAHSPSV